MSAIGFDAGLLTFLVALVVGVAFVVVAIALRFPKWAVLGLTALGGAGTAISGLLLILGTITIDGHPGRPVRGGLGRRPDLGAHHPRRGGGRLPGPGSLDQGLRDRHDALS